MPLVPSLAMSEYLPAALACQMSTTAPSTGAQLASARDDDHREVQRDAGLRRAVAGSVRMSERLSFSSTKYGPSVLAGISTQDVAAACASSATPIEPSSRSGPLTLREQQRRPAGAGDADGLAAGDGGALGLVSVGWRSEFMRSILGAGALEPHCENFLGIA